ncbi:hypothetical protein PV326_000168 [Microctonus aethiopoides]|nr:hypothetical protein PV326_000168 [Microctonus aethiopoides]
MISSFYERIVGASPPSEMNKPKILCVGLVCLDIVQTCKVFPSEDSDIRCIDYRWQRGGNASNNCTVLSKLGSYPEFFGTLGGGHHLNFLKDDMHKYSIDFSHCPVVDSAGCPTSTVILSLNTGSRTIFHYNPDLPELTPDDFEKLNLDDYSWIHFEGRRCNVPRILTFMQSIECYNENLKATSPNKQTITVSVELEKASSELLDLLPYADVAFISKDFACDRGFSNMSETIRNIARDVKSGATIICAWGDRGAMARTPDSTIVQSPAFPPKKIVDSLGAGDTFTAAILHYLNNVKLSSGMKDKNITEDVVDINNDKVLLSKEDNTSMTSDCYNLTQKKPTIEHNKNIESLECSKTEFINQSVLQAAVTFACRTAGAKIGFRGYDDLQCSPIEFIS